MGRDLTRPEPSALRRRVLSGLVLAPLPIAAVWFGSPWLPLLTALAACVMAWEWRLLCGGGRFGPVGGAFVGVVLAAVAAAAANTFNLAFAVAVAGAAVVFAFARARRDAEPKWLAAGVLWLALPCICLLWLAHPQNGGRATLLWLLAVVWATDIGAYAAGRTFGGPRLAPRWSPRKTWAGLVGGIVCAGIAGGATAGWLGMSPTFPLAALSAALAIVEQFGDVAESLAKRRFGVKDSSNLIPGHGGLLDRLDGFLAVVPAVALLTAIGGRSVLAWR